MIVIVIGPFNVLPRDRPGHRENINLKDIFNKSR